MKVYNKLVRDRIPEIIKANGETPIIHKLDDENYSRELNKKLIEEVKEFIEDGSMEELADVQEVIHGILLLKGKTIEDLEDVRREKFEKRGGFAKRIFLESVKENQSE